MRKHTLWWVAWLISVLVLLGSVVWGTAVSRAKEMGTIEPVLYLPLILVPDEAVDSGTDAEWLQYLNRFRQLADLPSVTEETTWSDGGVLHSRYMVKNDEITHNEDPGNSWYTAEGAAAGSNGNIAVFGSATATDESAIDFWMTAPFHAVGILDPALNQTGLGSYREAIGTWETGVTLDVNRGRGAIPVTVTFPIYFPKNGGDYWLTSFGGNEWPDPITSCPGYPASTGAPIILQLGDGSVVPNVTDSSFKRGAVELEHCVIDETNYVNSSDLGAQNIGRIVLNIRDAVVILPREALAVNETYTASITNDSTTYTWSFNVVDVPAVTAVAPTSASLFYRIR